ncbi:MAG: hypothetical protein QOE42_1443, partial [Chloroflexota bacterium]|nr:hypothetical protein [Chloroflexota bacterium]
MLRSSAAPCPGRPSATNAVEGRQPSAGLGARSR